MTRDNIIRRETVSCEVKTTLNQPEKEKLCNIFINSNDHNRGARIIQRQEIEMDQLTNLLENEKINKVIITEGGNIVAFFLIGSLEEAKKHNISSTNWYQSGYEDRSFSFWSNLGDNIRKAIAQTGNNLFNQLPLAPKMNTKGIHLICDKLDAEQEPLYMICNGWMQLADEHKRREILTLVREKISEVFPNQLLLYETAGSFPANATFVSNPLSTGELNYLDHFEQAFGGVRVGAQDYLIIKSQRALRLPLSIQNILSRFLGTIVPRDTTNMKLNEGEYDTTINKKGKIIPVKLHVLNDFQKKTEIADELWEAYSATFHRYKNENGDNLLSIQSIQSQSTERAEFDTVLGNNNTSIMIARDKDGKIGSFWIYFTDASKIHKETMQDNGGVHSLCTEISAQLSPLFYTYTIGATDGHEGFVTGLQEIATASMLLNGFNSGGDMSPTTPSTPSQILITKFLKIIGNVNRYLRIVPAVKKVEIVLQRHQWWLTNS